MRFIMSHTAQPPAAIANVIRIGPICEKRSQMSFGAAAEITAVQVRQPLLELRQFRFNIHHRLLHVRYRYTRLLPRRSALSKGRVPTQNGR